MKVQCLFALFALSVSLFAQDVLIEAEGFDRPGGWVLDTQFVQQMGSPILLAHGMGVPVSNATTTAVFPAIGHYRVWVRTRDWVPTRPEAPGQFRLAVNGVALAPVFGTETAHWDWQDGGVIFVDTVSVAIALVDLTGFDGRCDAVAFLADTNGVPPNDDSLAGWRRSALGEPAQPALSNTYDCVVVGGGLAGCCAAIAAAREGVHVALLQDRPVLGGNASQEIRVGTQGEVRHGIVSAVRNTHVSKDDGMIQDDTNRHAVLQGEANVDLHLNWRAFGVVTNVEGRLLAVDAKHTSTGEGKRFIASTFIDCTGDGWLGYWSGAECRVGREATTEFGEDMAPETPDAHTMGTSLQWKTRDGGTPAAFPTVPWAMDVAGSRAETGGGWNWEYGFYLDTIDDAEQIRDHLFRAIYGTFYNAKQAQNTDGTLKYPNHVLDWVPYVAGKRESRRIMGDHILKQSDIENGVFFEDSVGTATWSIDLHVPTSVDYRSKANMVHVGRWYFPFRSLYSKDVPNLMMAGRCLSATHVGLGSPRVMHTCGQMGVATGYAASLCKRHGIEPRDIYRSGDRMLELQTLIGGTWPSRPPPFVAVLDNSETNAGVVVGGDWTESTSEPGYYLGNYIHDGNNGKGGKYVSFSPNLPEATNYRVMLRWTSGNTRATNAAVGIYGSAQRVRVPASAGNYLRNAQPDATFATNEMWVGRMGIEDGARALMTFDLSGIPDDAVVLSADLDLFVSQRDPGALDDWVGDRGIEVFNVTESYDPAGVSWSNRQAGTPWTAAGGTFDAVPLTGLYDPTYPGGVSAGERFNFPASARLVGDVKNGLAGDRVDLIVRTPTLEDNWDQYGSRKVYRFASPAHTDTNLHPVVEITYVSGSPDFATTVNQRENSATWVDLGTHALSSGGMAAVVIRNDGTSGHVIADAVGFTLPDSSAEDSDGDGMPNWWERWWFFSETAGIAGADLDLDGMNNYGEYLAGTVPTDPLSVLSARALIDGVAAGTVLTWPSTSNRVYAIYTTCDLGEPFTNLVSGLPGNPPVNSYTVRVDRASQYFEILVEE